MVRWPYRIVNLGTANAGPRLGRALSYFGRLGWELVAVYDKESNWLQGFEKGYLLFKRPVPEGGEPDGPWTELWMADQVDAAYGSVEG